MTKQFRSNSWRLDQGERRGIRSRVCDGIGGWGESTYSLALNGRHHRVRCMRGIAELITNKGIRRNL